MKTLNAILYCGKNDYASISGEEIQAFIKSADTQKLINNKTVIMGRKLYEELGRKPIPSCFNIVITKRKFYYLTAILGRQEKIIFVSSRRQALEFAQYLYDDAYVLGGMSIFEKMWKNFDTIYLTVFKDRIFGKEKTIPFINPDRHELVSNKNFFTFTKLIYKKITKTNMEQ